jgi:hypothetical protein
MAQAASVPIYLNWTFWAVLIATIALILSQLPPLYNLLKRAKLDLEIFSRILIDHKVGNPNVNLYLGIRNIGGKTVRIKGVTIYIKRDEKSISPLPAQTYFRKPNDITTAMLFTPFSLKSREEWSNLVRFFRVFSREEEKQFRTAETALRNNIFQKKQLFENKDKLVEADVELVNPFFKMFQALFEWKPGEYVMQVSIETVPERAHVQKKYTFTLFESDSIELTQIQDNYRYGDAIFWDSSLKAISVPIKEA